MGGVIVVKAGERVPLDGVVLAGESFLDTRALTGESVPRRASVGDEVFSGTMRGAGESLRPMIMTLLGICLLRVLWVKLVAPLRPDSFLFMLACYPLSWSVTSVLFVIYYLTGIWLKRCKKKAGFAVE